MLKIERDEPLAQRRLKMLVLIPFFVIGGPFFMLWEHREEYFQVIRDIEKAWRGEWV